MSKHPKEREQKHKLVHALVLFVLAVILANVREKLDRSLTPIVDPTLGATILVFFERITP